MGYLILGWHAKGNPTRGGAGVLTPTRLDGHYADAETAEQVARWMALEPFHPSEQIAIFAVRKSNSGLWVAGDADSSPAHFATRQDLVLFLRGHGVSRAAADAIAAEGFKGLAKGR